MLFSSFSTRSMVFAYFTKAQLPFFLFRDLFNDTAEFTLCYGLHDCSHLFQGYFIHSLSTLYYYNAPSLTTRLTGDYRDRTYTGKCSPALLDTHKIKEQSFGMPILPGIAALLLFLFLLYVPVPLSESYLNILLGTSCFLALSALLRYLERSDKKQRIQKPIIRFSGYTYGIFLIHHILIGEFTLPHAETTMSLPQMWILFFCYLVYISVCGAVLTRFSGWCIRTIRNYLSCRKNRGNYNSTIR